MSRLTIFIVGSILYFFFFGFNIATIIIGIILLRFIVPYFVKNEEPDNPFAQYKKEWRELRKKVLLRDNCRCAKCKKSFKDKKTDIHVHHILERSHGGEDSMDNLMLLCVDCHSTHHENSHKPMHASMKKRIIEEAIRDNKCLNINYRSESKGGIGKNTNRKIKPDKFYSENGHYYVSGHCYLTNEYRYFRVSRITKFHQE